MKTRRKKELAEILHCKKFFCNLSKANTNCHFYWERYFIRRFTGKLTRRNTAHEELEVSKVRTRMFLSIQWNYAWSLWELWKFQLFGIILKCSPFHSPLSGPNLRWCEKYSLERLWSVSFRLALRVWCSIEHAACEFVLADAAQKTPSEHYTLGSYAVRRPVWYCLPFSLLERAWTKQTGLVLHLWFSEAWREWSVTSQHDRFVSKEGHNMLQWRHDSCMSQLYNSRNPTNVLQFLQKCRVDMREIVKFS